jgi:sec-independent protein translocase protein TatA
MSFGNIGFGEIMMLLVIVLLLFGAKRIPEIAGSMGKGIREFKKSINEVQNSVQSDISASDDRDRLRAREAPPRAEDEAPRPEPKRLLQ